MKGTALHLKSVAGLLIALFMVTQTALAHKNNVNLTVSFNPNPAPAGPPATITATLIFDGTQGSGSATGHVYPTAGDPVVGQKVQIQEWMVSGVGAACGTAGGGWVRIDGAGPGLITNSSGQASMSFNTTGLAGQTIGFRAHHPCGRRQSWDRTKTEQLRQSGDR